VFTAPDRYILYDATIRYLVKKKQPKQMFKTTQQTLGELFPTIATTVFQIPDSKLRALEKELTKQNIRIPARLTSTTPSFVEFRLFIILTLKNDLHLLPNLQLLVWQLADREELCCSTEEAAVTLTLIVENRIKKIMGKPTKHMKEALGNPETYNKILNKYKAHLKLWDGHPSQNQSVTEFKERFTLRDVTL